MLHLLAPLEAILILLQVAEIDSAIASSSLARIKQGFFNTTSSHSRSMLQKETSTVVLKIGGKHYLLKKQIGKRKRVSFGIIMNNVQLHNHHPLFTRLQS